VLRVQASGRARLKKRLPPAHVAPVVAAATYVGMVAFGYAVMRLIANPARGDRLAGGPWEAA